MASSERTIQHRGCDIVLRTCCVKNGLVVAVILLLVGVAVQPSLATVQPVEETIDVEPKDYLFKTIIDIANNTDVKNLFEHYNHRMFTSDYDYKGVFSKLMFRKPRLLFNVLFTRPSISYDYLDKCYNRGIEITNILGEDKVLEMMKSIEVTNPKVLDELNNIIINDEELSDRLVILEEMNKELNSIGYPIICGILLIISIGAMVPITIGLAFLSFLFYLNIIFKEILKLNGIDKLILQMTVILLFIGFILFILTSHFCDF